MTHPSEIRVGLRGRLVGLVLLVLLGLLGVIAVLALLRAEVALVDAQQARFAAVTRQLAESLRYAVLARSPALLDPGLDVFARSPDLVRVEILDEDHALLSSRDGDADPTRRAAGEVRIEVPVKTQGDVPGGDDGDLAMFGVESQTPRLVGYVVATFSTAATAQVQKRVRREILAAFAVLGTLGLLSVLLIASSVVRRAQLLAGAAEQVAAGDFATRVEEQGNDELTALARNFNAMTTALAGQRQALDEAAEQLAEREALAGIGRATAVIAHELKNPLGILLGAAEIAANPKRPEATRHKAVQIIVDEVPRLERTLRELLHYARPAQPNRVEVDIRELCQQVASRATHPGGPAEGLEVAFEGESVPVMLDEHQANQVLLNLLTNAAQAGATRVLFTTGGHAPGPARVDIVDDGPGIDPAIKDQLFRPFVTTKQRGVGLGLAGSRRMARDNGGNLRLEESSTGAHFVLELAKPEDKEHTP